LEFDTTDPVRKYDKYDIINGWGKMGTIVARTRKDGSKAFTAQIVIKKGGAIVTARRRHLTASKLPMPGSLNARLSSNARTDWNGRRIRRLPR
jgi:hypothetical protein